MSVVMTLLVRDEVDVLRAHLDYHLAAGVDFVIATDNGSTDGTTELLQEYARAGVVRLLHEPVGEFRQREWVTRMARLAATDHGARWVINSDADEFWWPQGGSLREVLAEIPARYGIVGSLVRHFLPVADDGRPFWERMVYRLTPQAPVNDPASPWRPYRKIVHRADPQARLVDGSHTVRGTSLQTLHGWYPIECLHFPLRSPAQVKRKGEAWAPAVEKFYGGPRVARAAGAVYHALQHQAAVSGESDAYYESLALSAEQLEEGQARGVVVLDVRVRDAVAGLTADPSSPGRPLPLGFRRPTTLETVGFAVDAAVLAEADVIRTRRWLDELDLRVHAMERLATVRVARAVQARAVRLLRR